MSLLAPPSLNPDGRTLLVCVAPPPFLRALIISQQRPQLGRFFLIRS
ncbi:hypothetical protein F558DRAFT_06242 [Streptomyces sp. AmelKG-A3]|nr:hypothetical protein GA0115247_13292 [Streptomyces sp. PalvLS-984]SDE43856.1 hypothetical protein F558DRAFT_06242 [Streptomyces sp. AmelKG-A3]